ncbi:hypothetical protein PHYPO_G00158510 [Pangasianodon hypophthalmus]|uniref:Uncharacterized protein n=1 Tax=Pangasianodon hypophthalmus TaxID=310915 RepID=A0A5N5JSM5_PANHP|nr:hypothetical protein PHYPO_G00158510 [Pangasianodon hypophthalmus]
MAARSVEMRVRSSGSSMNRLRAKTKGAGDIALGAGFRAKRHLIDVAEFRRAWESLRRDSIQVAKVVFALAKVLEQT